MNNSVSTLSASYKTVFRLNNRHCTVLYGWTALFTKQPYNVGPHLMIFFFIALYLFSCLFQLKCSERVEKRREHWTADSKNIAMCRYGRLVRPSHKESYIALNSSRLNMYLFLSRSELWLICHWSSSPVYRRLARRASFLPYELFLQSSEHSSEQSRLEVCLKSSLSKLLGWWCESTDISPIY